MSKQTRKIVRAQPRSTALAVRRVAGRLAVLERTVAPLAPKSVIEQLIELAKDPTIDVVKIEKLIDANERVMRHQAKQAFDAAFTVMQGEIPIINRDGRITVSARAASGDRSARDARSTPFATNPNIQRTVKPILAKHGFGLRFRHVPGEGTLTVIGILTHMQGHSEQDEFTAPNDESGGKNPQQARGSTRSYGQRYTTKALLNITDYSEVDLDGGTPADSERNDRPPTTRGPAPVPFDARLVTERQLKRLYAITSTAKRSHDEVKAWLNKVYGFTSSRQMTMGVYDEVIAAIEMKGDLPVFRAGAREPGSEG